MSWHQSWPSCMTSTLQDSKEIRRNSLQIRYLCSPCLWLMGLVLLISPLGMLLTPNVSVPISRVLCPGCVIVSYLEAKGRCHISSSCCCAKIPCANRPAASADAEKWLSLGFISSMIPSCGASTGNDCFRQYGLTLSVKPYQLPYNISSSFVISSYQNKYYFKLRTQKDPLLPLKVNLFLRPLVKFVFLLSSLIIPEQRWVNVVP